MSDTTLFAANNTAYSQVAASTDSVFRIHNRGSLTARIVFAGALPANNVTAYEELPPGQTISGSVLTGLNVYAYSHLGTTNLAVTVA